MSLEGPMRDLVRSIVEELRPAVLEDMRRLLREELSAQRAAPNNRDAVHDTFLSSAQAAEVAGVQPAAVRRWIARGDVPSHRAGRLVRVRLDDLKAFLARPTGSPSAGGPIDLDARAGRILRRHQAGGS